MTEEKDDSVVSSKCSVCGEKFINLQECLKHELITHSLQKRTGPKNLIQKQINATSKFLNTDDKKLERERLIKQLKICENGEELKAILRLFCIKNYDLGLIFTRIQTCLEKELIYGGVVKIYPFGSIASGLALRDCDIDIFIDASSMNNNNITKPFNYINKLLHRSAHFSDVFAIRKARVPIIKCTHNDTGFSIDINISYPSSRENTQFLHDLVETDTRIHELMLFLKLWAKHTRIVMTSYCLITMVIFFLQQPRQKVNEGKGNEKDSRILKSMKELQENCQFRIVQGVNYAYDLKSEENNPQIPASVTTWDLIKGFFEFYENFDFENHVISSFYGKAIAKDNITPDICEEYYKQLKTITQYLQGEPANNLQINSCMCVQDIFCLNQNTAKNITPRNKEYILFCLKNANKICENPQNLTPAQLYIQLLYETTSENVTEKKENVKAGIKTVLKNSQVQQANCNLSYTLVPSKADLQSATAHYPQIAKGNEILHCWCRHYIDAIYLVLTELYRMDVHKQLPTQQKQQKFDEEESERNLNSSWEISCTIDLWTNRCFQKNSQVSFVPYQLQQTERLHNLRRQDPKYTVTLNGILKLNILPNNVGIEIIFELPQEADAASISKKSPMRKFFNVFKNTLTSFSFKEILNINNTNAETSETANTTDTGIATDNADNS